MDKADPAMVAYHDDEWGRPVSDDVALFERLALEGFQAGLSWSTILHKREAFVRAFDSFDPARVRTFDQADRARLMADAGIVRNGPRSRRRSATRRLSWRSPRNAALSPRT